MATCNRGRVADDGTLYIERTDCEILEYSLEHHEFLVRYLQPETNETVERWCPADEVRR